METERAPDLEADPDSPRVAGCPAPYGSPVAAEPWIGNCPKCHTAYRTTAPDDLSRPLNLPCGRLDCVGTVEMTPIGGIAKPDCDPPLGELGEAYYCKRDDFTRYIADQVNPAREAAGLQPLCWRTAEECYRILNDFARQWGCNPIQEND